MSILTVQPSGADTGLYEYYPATNYGNDDAYCRVQGNYGSTYRMRPVLRFDFSALPDGAVIDATEFDLNYFDNDGAGGRNYCVYELTQGGWLELEACWTYYKGITAWAAAGGDYVTGNGASVVMPGSYGWVSWNVLALVQHFQSAHSKIANFILMDGSEACSAYGCFHSNVYATPSLRPKLILSYTLPGGQPTIKRFGGVPFARTQQAVWYRPHKLVAPTMKEILKYNRGGW